MHEMLYILVGFVGWFASTSPSSCDVFLPKKSKHEGVPAALSSFLQCLEAHLPKSPVADGKTNDWFVNLQVETGRFQKFTLQVIQCDHFIP